MLGYVRTNHKRHKKRTNFPTIIIETDQKEKLIHFHEKFTKDYRFVSSDPVDDLPIKFIS